MLVNAAAFTGTERVNEGFFPHYSKPQNIMSITETDCFAEMSSFGLISFHTKPKKTVWESPVMVLHCRLSGTACCINQQDTLVTEI